MEVMMEQISDAEWEVMRVVWSKKQTTSNEVIGVLTDKMMWKPSTVKTLLARLVDKKYLSTKKEGKQFIYQPLMAEKTCIENQTDQLLNKICAKKIGDTVLHIISKKDMSLSDIDKLENILNEKRKTAVETIACDCLPGQCTCKE